MVMVMVMVIGNVMRLTSVSSVRSVSTVLVDTRVHVLVAIGPQVPASRASVSTTAVLWSCGLVANSTVSDKNVAQGT